MTTVERYDNLAANYDARWNAYNRVVCDKVLRHWPSDIDGARVLDVGCGTGFFLEELLWRYENIAEVTALDPSREMLAKARARLSATSQTTINFVQAAAEILPLEAARFDVVVLLNVLHYLTEPRNFFTEAHRVLAPGGTLIVQDYTHNAWPLFETAARFFDGGLKRLYTPRELTDFAQDAGFDVCYARSFRISSLWRGVLLVAKKSVN